MTDYIHVNLTTKNNRLPDNNIQLVKQLNVTYSIEKIIYDTVKEFGLSLEKDITILLDEKSIDIHFYLSLDDEYEKICNCIKNIREELNLFARIKAPED